MKAMADRMDTLTRIVRQVANYYAKRVWYIELDELQQEAWLHALEAASWAPDDDDKFAGYVYAAVSRNLSRYTRRQSCPVSLTTHGDERAGEGMHRAAVSDVAVFRAATHTTPERAYIAAEAPGQILELRQQLLERAGVLYRMQGGTSEAQLSGALQVLFDGAKPAEVAKSAGLPVRALYKVTEWVKSSCVQDEIVRGLLSELQERRCDCA